MIDLRSDTVTKPTPEMRAVIADAPVGDDLFHDDPTVLALEAKVSEILGTDDAVYVPSGTMGNQIAIRTHTEPGDVVLASEKAHINRYEVGAANALSGVTIRELPSRRGVFTAAEVRSAVPALPRSLPATVFQPVKLIAAENTHNGAGGTIWPLEALQEVVATARDLGVATHLDGARLWNASATTGIDVADYAAGFDTISVCFSKGLGAPMGSALAGTKDLITRARRFKQMLGGGFRQAGMMAAGALYALEHHRSRLTEDHKNAFRLAAGLAETEGIHVDLDTVATNMVYFTVTARPAGEFAEACLARGVAVLPMSDTTVRAVLHLDISSSDVDDALTVFASAARP